MAADHIWAVKGGRRDRKKDGYAVNDAKLQGIVNNQGDYEKRLFLRAKHMSAWLSVGVTTVTGNVLAAMQFRNFYVLVITSTPLTSKGNVTVA